MPAPSQEELAHSAELVARVRSEIVAAGGSISFERYMELALYCPGLGYYSAGAHKLGAGGDFITAPELSSRFASCIAMQIREILRHLGGGSVLEVGAGSGAMAAVLVGELDRNGGSTPYLILERSADLKERQARFLAGSVPGAAVEWVDDLPRDFRGVVIANELLDSFPVRRFVSTPGGTLELRVRWGARGLESVATACTPSAALTRALEEIREWLGGEIPSGNRFEIGFASPAWVGEVVKRLAEGVILILDYGYPRAEFYHPERYDGTLRCFFRHRAHDDPFVLPGLQDISAHVDFTAIAQAAESAGAAVAGFTTQAGFLLATGITSRLDHVGYGSRERVELVHQIKRLILPGEMGELVKVLAIEKNYLAPLVGFSLRDSTPSLYRHRHPQR